MSNQISNIVLRNSCLKGCEEPGILLRTKPSSIGMDEATAGQLSDMRRDIGC